MNFGVWTIFHGAGAASILGTPWGRQLASGSSLEWEPSMRCSKSALAHVWNGTWPGWRSAARLRRYLLALGSQTPERSGLPPANRGAGAERLGRPSPVRGMPESGTLVHCATRGEDIQKTAASAAGIGLPAFTSMGLPPGLPELYTALDALTPAPPLM